METRLSFISMIPLQHDMPWQQCTLMWWVLVTQYVWTRARHCWDATQDHTDVCCWSRNDDNSVWGNRFNRILHYLIRNVWHDWPNPSFLVPRLLCMKCYRNRWSAQMTCVIGIHLLAVRRHTSMIALLRGATERKKEIPLFLVSAQLCANASGFEG